MSKGEWFSVGVVIGIMLAFIILVTSNPYKQGQIDALTGKVKYELRMDSTWVKKGKQ